MSFNNLKNLSEPVNKGFCQCNIPPLPELEYLSFVIFYLKKPLESCISFDCNVNFVLTKMQTVFVAAVDNKVSLVF